MVSTTTVTEDAGITEGADTIAAPPPNRNYLSLGRNLIKQFVQCMLAAAVGYGCFQFSSRYIFQSVQVDGCSMAPTLGDTERYILNRAIYHVREPRLQDVVVLRDPVDNSYLVKRIVAKQGDSVHLKGGKIFVNGQLLKESYLPQGTMTFGDPHYREQMWICGRNQYFVLGDNRNNSADSRIYGAVSRQSILGLVML